MSISLMAIHEKVAGYIGIVSVWARFAKWQGASGGFKRQILSG
jgi:hypothetical protein